MVLAASGFRPTRSSMLFEPELELDLVFNGTSADAEPRNFRFELA
jgi:hypothetical protein